MSNAGTVETVPSSESSASPATAKLGAGAILVPVLLSTVLTMGAVACGVFYLIHSGKLGSSVAGAQPPGALPQPVIIVAPPPSHVVALDPMIVNLSDPGGRSYLRAAVSLRIRDEDKKEEKKDPKVPDTAATELRDTTLTVLSRQTSDTLLAPDGREALKRDLQHEYKERDVEIPVMEVYFTDFLVQRG